MRQPSKRHSRLPLVAGALAIAIAGLVVMRQPGGGPPSPVATDRSTPPPATSSPGAVAVAASRTSPRPTVTGSLPPAPDPATATCSVEAVPGSVSPSLPEGPPSSAALHVPVLMYHRIVPPREAGNSLAGLVVPPATFAAQMDALAAAGWRTIPMSELARDLLTGSRPPARSFVPTFDDGYVDGYTYALPILRRLGFNGTFFVIAGRIGHPNNLTPAQLRDLVAAGNEIGDHTVNHVDVRTLSAAQLRYQIDGAAERVAQIVGRWPVAFAYPYGAVDPAGEAAVARCPALRLAFTTVNGVGETWASRLALPRLRVGPDTTPAGLLAAMRQYG